MSSSLPLALVLGVEGVSNSFVAAIFLRDTQCLIVTAMCQKWWH